MRIGFFTDRYLPQTDGISVSVQTFCEQLEKLGHQVYIFAPKPNLRYKETSSNVIRFPAVKGLGFEENLTSFFFPPQFTRKVEKLKLDIIHFHTPGPIGLFGVHYALQYNLPLVTTYHTDLYGYVDHYPKANVLAGGIILSMLALISTKSGLDNYRSILSSIKPNRNSEKWRQKIVVQIMTLLHNSCDLVIAPSDKIQKQLKSWKTKSPITVLPTGVDKITTKKTDSAKIRQHYHLQPENKIILFVGRVGSEKNISLLIDAFGLVAAQEPEAKLVIVGPGDYMGKFKDQAENSSHGDRILFTGRIEYSRLGGIYSLADVFAFPSLTDTQAMVINEAACAGAPIVMIDKDVSKVLVDGENGYYSSKNKRDFAAKITKILKNNQLRAKMSARSIQLGSEYSAKNQAHKLFKLYQSVIKNHQSSQSQQKLSD